MPTIHDERFDHNGLYVCSYLCEVSVIHRIEALGGGILPFFFFFRALDS